MREVHRTRDALLPTWYVGIDHRHFFRGFSGCSWYHNPGHSYRIETFCQLTSRGLKADVFKNSMLPASNMYSLCGIVWRIV